MKWHLWRNWVPDKNSNQRTEWVAGASCNPRQHTSACAPASELLPFLKQIHYLEQGLGVQLPEMKAAVTPRQNNWARKLVRHLIPDSEKASLVGKRRAPCTAIIWVTSGLGLLVAGCLITSTEMLWAILGKKQPVWVGSLHGSLPIRT